MGLAPYSPLATAFTPPVIILTKARRESKGKIIDNLVGSELPPHHLVHHPDVALDNADDLGRDVLVHVVRHGDARETIADERDGDVDALKKALRVDAAEDEAAFVQGFGTLRRRTDTNRRERMSNTCKERRFLGKGSRVRNHRKRIHLQAIVIMEAQGLVANHARVKLEPTSLQPLPGTRVAAIQNRHIILRRHLVDGIEQAQEVLFRVDVLLSVGAQEDVLALLEAQARMDVGCLDLGEIVMQHLRHRRAGHVRALLRKARVCQVAAGVLRIGHIDIGDNVYNTAVRLLRQALILATVAGLHVEDRDVQPLRSDDRETGVRVTQHQNSIGFDLRHQLVTLRDDIAHGLAQVRTHRVHVHIRVSQLQVLEEHPVQVVVIVLARVRQDRVEILPALVDDRRQPDNFRAGADDDQKLQLPVILEFCHMLSFFFLSAGNVPECGT